MFEKYTPQQLRDAIQLEMQKCDDPVQASYNAIAKLEKAEKEKSNLEKANEKLKSVIAYGEYFKYDKINQ